MHYSPLRYPGGKSKLASFIAKICIDNNISDTYIEPYAGGASVALDLLMNNVVEKIHINDADRSIYAFWYCLVNHPEVLMQVIQDTTVDMDTWEFQREVQKRKNNCDILDLAVSTFFLNRTNRSGILKAGVIGGNDQSGNYKIGCRFNKINLLKRIELIASKRDKITITNLDAVELIKQLDNERENFGKLAYFDPPYYYKAESLYMNHYKPEDHLMVSNHIKSIKKFHFVVSYDDTPEIRNLYNSLRQKRYSFTHNIINSRKGYEILFFDNNLNLSDLSKINPVGFKRLRSKKNEIVYIKPKTKSKSCHDF